MGTVLLTGATGFLGAHIASRLVKETDHSIAALVRAEDKEAALRRLSRTWWDWTELIQALGGRVKVITGDVAQPYLGLGEVDYHELVRVVTHIIHTAADLRLNAPLNELRTTNVNGTANVLQFATEVHHDHKLIRLSHVSTAYVAGGKTGSVSEDSLADTYGFYSNYEVSKYEGERLVQQAKSHLPISVFRPGLVVGDSRTGAIKTFNTLYFPLRLYLTRQPSIIPVRPSLRINMVPVDYVADAVTKLTFIPEAEGLNFHLVVPWEKLPTAGELINFLRTWAKGRMNLKLPYPLFLPLPVPATRARYRAQGMMNRDGRGVLDALLTIVPYFNERRRFLCDNTERLLGPYEFHWQEVLPAMMDFAVSKGFMHRSERTVHEQILFRLRSKNMPVTYYNIIEGHIVKQDTRRVRDEMLATAAAMQGAGIGKGDRVALLGLNGTRYLVVDVAIGLLGAVSVPLYNTSPPSEIEQILASSQSKLLFVGAPGVLERLDELATKIPVVSFCRRNPENLPIRKVITWDEFLATGKGIKAPSTAPVTFDDLATVRYTSGTTGRVKGVCFDHEGLRWMSESTCSVMNSWRALNIEMSHLSYLPMNHVVEGILANYSAYYTPASFHIYFVEDISDLPFALRKVQPHVLFSVPRLYEKIWESLRMTGLGKSYISMVGGFRRRLLRKFLCRTTLRKAGLNRCAQLIVGSAPMSEVLLHDFRELGIEIYNAYGLTEAPLVTVNKLGANRINTVGEPLPDTVISIAEDDEVLVKGPQVARGYFNGNTCTSFNDGWLHTGDLGYITGENSLVLHGRKKEVIVTSYGKNIHPIKIEAMLKNIPDVTEAMLIGDTRPFCTAILWVSRDGHDPVWLTKIEQAIVEINKQLSRPEQVKRWAILKNELSIERGELTASLKLKRAELISRLAETVEALYSKLSPGLYDAVYIDGLAAEQES
jgi:long-chain acyl-CoA synthetase